MGRKKKKTLIDWRETNEQWEDQGGNGGERWRTGGEVEGEERGFHEEEEEEEVEEPYVSLHSFCCMPATNMSHIMRQVRLLRE